MKQKGYASLLLMAVMLMALTTVAIGAHQVGVRGQRAFAHDRDVVQARLAADTGIERAIERLLAVPSTRDGSFAEGPVGDRARVEGVGIEYDPDSGVITITAVGVSGRARRTAWARISMSAYYLVESYGGGIKVLYHDDEFWVLDLRGRIECRADMLVVGGMHIHDTAVNIGTPEKPRSLYMLGDITKGFSAPHPPVKGWAYASGHIDFNMATHGSYYWHPGDTLPEIDEIDDILESALLQAVMLEATTPFQYLYPGGTTLNLGSLPAGIYYVDGEATISGFTDEAVFVGTTGNMHLTGQIEARSTVLVSGADMDIGDTSNLVVGALMAKGDIGWGGTGSQADIILRYGAMASTSLNSQMIWGNIELEQDDDIDLSQLPGIVNAHLLLGRGGD